MELNKQTKQTNKNSSRLTKPAFFTNETSPAFIREKQITEATSVIGWDVKLQSSIKHALLTFDAAMASGERDSERKVKVSHVGDQHPHS